MRAFRDRGTERSAEKEAAQALQIDDGFVQARLTMARILVADRKAGNAIPHLQRVLKDQPGHVPAALMLADLHAREFRYDQAIPVLESAARATAEDAITLTLANLYIRAGRFDEAIARLAPLLKENPNLVQARFITGLAQLGKRDVSGAIAQFEAVTRVNPDFADGHYYLGRALLTRGNVDGAKKEYQRAADLAPDSKQIRIEMAAVLGGKPDPAVLTAWIEELKAAVAKDPTNIERREELGTAYAMKAQLAEAEAEFKRVLEVAPLSPKANRGMALMRFAQKKPDEAVPHLQTLLRVDPTNVEANLMLASYYESKGNRDQAITYLEAVVRVNPGLVDVKGRLAQLYGATGRTPQGIARAKEVVASEPKSAGAMWL